MSKRDEEIAKLLKAEQASRDENSVKMSARSLGMRHKHIKGVMNKLCWHDENISLEEYLITEEDKLIAMLNSYKSLETRKSYGICFWYLYKNGSVPADVFKKFNDYLESVKRATQSQKLHNAVEIKENDTVWLKEWNKLRETLLKNVPCEEDFKKMTYHQLVPKIISALYSLTPPLRPVEWLSTKFGELDDGISNILDLERGLLIINSSKGKKYNSRKFRLNGKLIEILKLYHNTFKRENVIEGTSEDVTKSLGIGINSKKTKDSPGIRAIFTSAVDSFNIAQMSNTADYIIDHSRETSQMYYNMNNQSIASQTGYNDKYSPEDNLMKLLFDVPLPKKVVKVIKKTNL